VILPTIEGPEMKFVDFDQVLVILKKRHYYLSYLFKITYCMSFFIKQFFPSNHWEMGRIPVSPPPFPQASSGVL